MKKFNSIAILLLFAASAHAAVTVSCAMVGTTKDVDISYNTDANSVRAFALDISVNGGAKIIAVSCASTAYYVYPGSIQIASGSVSSYGSCVCDATMFPGVTQPGLNSSAVTIEMGSLYTGTNKPANSGVLARLTVDVIPTTVTIAMNTARGGVVMERAEEVPVVTLTTCQIAPCPCDECFPSGYTSYNDWKSAGRPDCWCGTNTNGMTTFPPVKWPFQCYGDCDNKTETALRYRISNGDYWCLKSNWLKRITDPTWNRCSDFNHKSETVLKYRVYTGDYWRLRSNWLKKDSNFPGSGNCPITE